MEVVKKGGNYYLPKVVDSQLGRGICGVSCKYNQTFFFNSEKGYYANVESDVFALWKQKLKKFEEKNAVKANHIYRTEKRSEKQ